MKGDTETIRTIQDKDCPKCGFPETVVVRNFPSMEPIAEMCSSHTGCDWARKIIKKKPLGKREK